MPFCGSKRVKKNGTREANNATNVPPATSVSAAAADLTLKLYSDGKQSAAQLAEQHGCSLKTIRRHLAKAVTKAPGVTPQAAVNLIVDDLLQAEMGRHGAV